MVGDGIAEPPASSAPYRIAKSMQCRSRPPREAKGRRRGCPGRPAWRDVTTASARSAAAVAAAGDLRVVAATDGGLAEGWEAGSGRRKVTVTSVAPDGARALAFVPGDAEVGSVYGDDTKVEVVALVGADDAPPGHDPKVTRRRDRRS